MRSPRQLGLFAAPAERPRRGRPKKEGAGISHRARLAVSSEHPHHVTARFRTGTWNLRSQRCFGRIRAALEAIGERAGIRVVHYSVQGNHIHLLVEADDRRSMSNGLRALFIRIARGINRLMGVRGPRFADRYHERVLTSPRQVRNALRYVLTNHAHHVPKSALVDEFSSGPWFDGWQGSVRKPRWTPCTGPPTSRPGSWLLRSGWRRGGGLLA